MTGETVLTAVSLCMQGVGLWAAAVGFQQTFRDVADPSERLLASVWAKEVAFLRRHRAALARVLRRLFRRPPRSITMTLEPALSVEMAMKARGELSFGPLPDVTRDGEAFTAEVERRLNHIFLLAQSVEADLHDETEAREVGDQRVSKELGSRFSTLEEQSRRAEIQGLRTQVFGWCAVAAGLIVQSAADLWV
ncbi:hypothetical protein IPZ68_06070 [Streptomyces arenae]|nr:hypothetical protein [Streptomyces arenae]